MKRLFFIFALVLGAFIFNSSLAFAADSIKIGLMCPLTGAWASEGQDMQQVVTLLAEEVNKVGGIDGKKIEIITQDDAGDPRTAALAAQRLSTSEVVAIIGTYGSAVTEASQNIYDEAGLVQIATGSTSIRLSEKGLNKFFRTCPRDDEQGAVAVKILEKMGFKKVAVLHDNSAYAKGLADEIKGGLKDNKNIEIVFFDALRPGERDYNALLTKLKGTGPDAIMFTGYYPEAGMLLRQMAEMKWSVPMIGGDATNNSDLVKIAGPAASGYYFLTPPMPADLNSQDAKNFLEAYNAKYGAAPSSIWSVLAGDALKVLVEAIKKVGTDSEAIAKYLHTEFKDYGGLTGNISFNEKGDRVGDLYKLYQVNSVGEFELLP